MAGAVGANHAFDPSLALEAHHLRAADQGDAVRAMLLGKILRDTGRGHAIHDPVGHFQHRDFAAHFAARRGRLEPDVAAADDDDACLGFEARLNGGNIGEPAQVEHAGKRGPWAGQPARFCAETQQQSVIGQLLAVREFDLPCGGIETHGTPAQFEFDPMLVVKGAVPEGEAIGRHFARKVFLGERRPLVRQLRLVADQHQTAAKPFPPEGVDGLCAGLAAAYDENGGDHWIPWESLPRL